MVQYTRREHSVKHCTKVHIPPLESPIASGIIALIKTNMGYYSNIQLYNRIGWYLGILVIPRYWNQTVYGLNYSKLILLRFYHVYRNSFEAKD